MPWQHYSWCPLDRDARTGLDVVNKRQIYPYNNTNQMHKFLKFILEWNLHVSDNSFVRHQEFFTVHTATVYVIQVCRQLSSRIRMECSSILILLTSCLQTCMTYTTAVCTVKNSWWWTKELSKICRVSFQNKFEKLVHLVGFIIRICHDARSHLCKMIQIYVCDKKMNH